jgi:hypothetical protein
MSDLYPTNHHTPSQNLLLSAIAMEAAVSQLLLGVPVPPAGPASSHPIGLREGWRDGTSLAV